MKTRKLGNMEVSAIGMGCMGFTHAYGAAPEEKESIRLVHRAFDLGCNFSIRQKCIPISKMKSLSEKP